MYICTIETPRKSLIKIVGVSLVEQITLQGRAKEFRLIRKCGVSFPIHLVYYFVYKFCIISNRHLKYFKEIYLNICITVSLYT